MSLGSNSKPRVVVAGFIGKLPYAGMSLYNLHYIDGLEALGYQVHYVERIKKPQECYNPVTRALTDDPAFAVEYLSGLVSRFSFIDRENRSLDLTANPDFSQVESHLRTYSFPGALWTRNSARG
jgi:hypothetical protein